MSVSFLPIIFSFPFSYTPSSTNALFISRISLIHGSSTNQYTLVSVSRSIYHLPRQLHNQSTRPTPPKTKHPLVVCALSPFNALSSLSILSHKVRLTRSHPLPLPSHDSLSHTTCFSLSRFFILPVSLPLFPVHHSHRLILLLSTSYDVSRVFCYRSVQCFDLHTFVAF